MAWMWLHVPIMHLRSNFIYLLQCSKQGEKPTRKPNQSKYFSLIWVKLDHNLKYSKKHDSIQFLQVYEEELKDNLGPNDKLVFLLKQCLKSEVMRKT